MDDLIDLILDKLEEAGRNGECERQLRKVVKKEDEYLKGISKEKWNEYMSLEKEKHIYQSIELRQALEVAISLLKKLYK